jgi:hypothetical protein
MTRYNGLCLILLVIGGFILVKSMGCMLDTDSFSLPEDSVFTGGCFEHVEGREHGHLDFFTMERSYSFDGMGFGLSDLDTPEGEPWSFSGLATASEATISAWRN